MTVDQVAGGTAHDPGVEAEVRRAAFSQLLKGGPLAEAVQVLLVVVVAALVWNSLPLALTAGWVGAVTAAAALRTWWRLGLSRRTASPEEALRGVRLTVAGVGLAWGFGAAAAIPALGLDQAALIDSPTGAPAGQPPSRDARTASTRVAIAVLDGGRSIRSVNPAFETLFGYSTAEAVGASIDALIVPDSLRSESSDLEARARAGEIVRVEIERRRKDGRPIQVRLSAAAVKAAPEGGLVALYEDISDRKAAEQAMRAARELAERVARARSAFLANMSHEIRTPMNAVLGFVELVLDTGLQVEQRRALELVRSSSEALLTILNDILDYSKIEAEHLELESIPFDLPKVVHATATLLAVRAREKHLELTVDVPPDVPHMVRGDPTRVRQVLMNLIGNAIKFTEQGEVDVSAAVVGYHDQRTSVRLRVRDTGIGIPDEQLATIFDEFTQADASMTRRYGGTGLGLAISRKLVALMGGQLSVTSEGGRGSAFSL